MTRGTQTITVDAFEEGKCGGGKERRPNVELIRDERARFGGRRDDCMFGRWWRSMRYWLIDWTERRTSFELKLRHSADDSLLYIAIVL